MSAGAFGNSTLRVDASLLKLAPRFRAAVENALAECHESGLDAMVYEGMRSAELQAHYYERGRTIKPPENPVTNAKSNLYSWHGYGLAVDVISRSELWFNMDAKPQLRRLAQDHPDYETRRAERFAYASRGVDWFRAVAEVFKAHGCKWGGDWRMVDLPHFQWGLCKPSPSDRARELLAQGGLELVWREVGAL